MADSSEDEDDEEMTRLKEATAGVSEITSKDRNKMIKEKNDHNDVPARILTKLLDEMLEYTSSYTSTSVQSTAQTHSDSNEIKLLSSSKASVQVVSDIINHKKNHIMRRCRRRRTHRTPPPFSNNI